jgi:hypothetical protein
MRMQGSTVPAAVRRAVRLTARVRNHPELGPRIPAVVARGVFLLVCAGLAVAVLPQGFWFVVALLLAALGAAMPRTLAAWFFIALLGVNQAVHDPAILDWRFFVLLAGLHLVHVLAAQVLPLPIGAWVQVRVYARPLIRFAVIQLPAQLFALLMIEVFPRGGAPHLGVPLFAVIGGAALVALALVLIIPLLRERTNYR